MSTITRRAAVCQSATPTLPPGMELALNRALGVAEAIKELGEVSANSLYARLVQVMDYTTFCRILRLLRREGWIAHNADDTLKWLG